MTSSPGRRPSSTARATSTFLVCAEDLHQCQVACAIRVTYGVGARNRGGAQWTTPRTDQHATEPPGPTTPSLKIAAMSRTGEGIREGWSRAGRCSVAVRRAALSANVSRHVVFTPKANVFYFGRP